jgi:hypothetical protein
MKNGNDLKAAMGLLDWKIDDLVQYSGISKPTISAINQSKTSEEMEKFNLKTINSIISSINNAGVRFTEHGVERINYPVYFTSGDTHEEAYLELLRDARRHLSNFENPELLIMYADDRVSPTSVNSIYREMRNNGVKMRQLVREGNTYLMGDISEYRYVPKDNFVNRVALIYGNRFANETGDVLKGIIHEDSVQARIQRNNFNMLWDNLAQPEESTADERFE